MHLTSGSYLNIASGAKIGEAKKFFDGSSPLTNRDSAAYFMNSLFSIGSYLENSMEGVNISGLNDSGGYNSKIPSGFLTFLIMAR